MLMGPRLTKNLLMLADAYIKATGYTIGTLSKKAHSDTAFFERLKASEISFSVRKYDQIVVWFFTHWPDKVPWPQAVDIPTKRDVSAVLSEDLA
jgi:hypothetical protein